MVYEIRDYPAVKLRASDERYCAAVGHPLGQGAGTLCARGTNTDILQCIHYIISEVFGKSRKRTSRVCRWRGSHHFLLRPILPGTGGNKPLRLRNRSWRQFDDFGVKGLLSVSARTQGNMMEYELRRKKLLFKRCRVLLTGHHLVGGKYRGQLGPRGLWFLRSSCRTYRRKKTKFRKLCRHLWNYRWYYSAERHAAPAVHLTDIVWQRPENMRADTCVG